MINTHRCRQWLRFKHLHEKTHHSFRPQVHFRKLYCLVFVFVCVCDIWMIQFRIPPLLVVIRRLLVHERRLLLWSVDQTIGLHSFLHSEEKRDHHYISPLSRLHIIFHVKTFKKWTKFRILLPSSPGRFRCLSHL